ncbi:ribosomal protein S19e [Catenaria anguillulae PL171]|uniref:Ribosomal protein S19e n=1 Tax=Catenaria anguillulae PL171 TaxID=765915 RepID=A0A1Y2HNC1_9FUNG|nr:ribosomal protein S19e [Catenaria anguillulae PL171]
MATVKDVAAADFIAALSAHLKKGGKIQVPEWMQFAKTATFKELGPSDADFYYVHIAAVARHIYLRKGVGVGDLRKRFGGKERRGVRPNHSAVASGSLQRKALQTLEKLKYVEKSAAGGRQITATGRRELDRIANQVVAIKNAEAARLAEAAAAAAAVNVDQE